MTSGVGVSENNVFPTYIAGFQGQGQKRAWWMPSLLVNHMVPQVSALYLAFKLCLPRRLQKATASLPVTLPSSRENLAFPATERASFSCDFFYMFYFSPFC